MKLVKRGLIRNDGPISSRCKRCDHAKKSYFMLKCSVHKCTVHDHETCNIFAKKGGRDAK